jgi:phage baseplate assembly protein W
MEFDLNKNFTNVRNDINKISEEDSILEAVDNIIHISRGDIFGNYNLGSDVKKILFSRVDSSRLFNFVKKIEFALIGTEPRINNILIEVTYDADADVLLLNITANIINNNKKLNINKSISI